MWYFNEGKKTLKKNVLEGVTGTTRQQGRTKQMHFHSVLFGILADIAFWPPEKLKVISVFFACDKLMKCFLPVTSYGVGIPSEPAQNTDQIVGQVGSAEQMVIQRSSFAFR